MTDDDYTSFPRVPVEAFDQAQEAKLDDETWGEYIQRCAENPPVVEETVSADAIVEAMDVTNVATEGATKGATEQELKRLQSSVEAIEHKMDEIDELLRSVSGL